MTIRLQSQCLFTSCTMLQNNRLSSRLTISNYMRRTLVELHVEKRTSRDDFNSAFAILPSSHTRHATIFKVLRMLVCAVWRTCRCEARRCLSVVCWGHCREQRFLLGDSAHVSWAKPRPYCGDIHIVVDLSQSCFHRITGAHIVGVGGDYCFHFGAVCTHGIRRSWHRGIFSAKGTGSGSVCHRDCTHCCCRQHRQRRRPQKSAVW